KSTLGFAYVDNALALYCWAAALAVAVALESPWSRSDRADFINARHRNVNVALEPPRSQSDRAAVISEHPDWLTWAFTGFLAGAACGIKYFGVVYASGLCVVIVTAAAWWCSPSNRMAASRFTAAARAAAAYGLAVIL